jgi:hypothetical protein
LLTVQRVMQERTRAVLDALKAVVAQRARRETGIKGGALSLHLRLSDDPAAADAPDKEVGDRMRLLNVKVS